MKEIETLETILLRLGWTKWEGFKVGTATFVQFATEIEVNFDPETGKISEVFVYEN